MMVVRQQFLEVICEEATFSSSAKFKKNSWFSYMVFKFGIRKNHINYGNNVAHVIHF